MAEKTAKKLGIPRSQLYVKALEEFILIHSKHSVIEKLNSVYKKELSKSKSNFDAVSTLALRKSLKNDTW